MEETVDEEKVKTRTELNQEDNKRRKRLLVISYVKSIPESIRRVFKRYDVPLYFKPTNTLRQLLVRPKNKVEKEKVVGPVYHIQCGDC